MGQNTPSKAHGKDTPPLQHRSRTSGKGGSSSGQLSCGRRILASKYQRSGRPTTSTSSVWRENHTQSRTEVHLKERTGMCVGRGVLESQLKTGDDVAGLVLFPHHVAVRVMEVYACGGYESTEDGQVLKDCIGEIVRWSTSFIEPINMVHGGTRSKTSTNEAFDVNEDNLCKRQSYQETWQIPKNWMNFRVWIHLELKKIWQRHKQIVVYLELMVCHPIFERISTQ